MIEDSRQLEAMPLADRAPPFNAIVARYLHPVGQRTECLKRNRQRPRDKPVDGKPPISELLADVPRVIVPARRAGAVGAEDRRHVAFAIFPRQRVAGGNQPLTRERQLLGRAQRGAECWAVVELVASAEQQARRAGGDEGAAVDHGSRSSGTRKRPVIIEPISLIGPARSTIVR